MFGGFKVLRYLWYGDASKAADLSNTAGYLAQVQRRDDQLLHICTRMQRSGL